MRQYKDISAALLSPVNYEEDDVAQKWTQLLLNNVPIVSGSHYSYIRNTFLDKLKPNKRGSISVDFGDGTTGNANDIFSVSGDDYEFDFDTDL